MTTSGLPPQAYTKETLADAYEWVKSQPADIRRAASSSDALVGLYLSAMRRKQEGFDSFYDRARPASANDSAPISGEQFKKELKNLAIGLNEFTDDSKLLPPLSPPPKKTMTSDWQNPSQTSTPAHQRPPHVGPNAATKVATSVGLDPVSQERLAVVKSTLNLSSETEALRMLISLGFEKMKGILPPVP